MLQLTIAPSIVVSQLLFPLLADLGARIESSSPVDALSWTTSNITLSKHGCLLRWRRGRAIVLGWLLLRLGLLILGLRLIIVLRLWLGIRLGILGAAAPKEFLAFILEIF